VYLRFPGAVLEVGDGYEFFDKGILRQQGNSNCSLLRLINTQKKPKEAN
jgi:hypothetical protein